MRVRLVGGMHDGGVREVDHQLVRRDELVVLEPYFGDSLALDRDLANPSPKVFLELPVICSTYVMDRPGPDGIMRAVLVTEIIESAGSVSEPGAL